MSLNDMLRAILRADVASNEQLKALYQPAAVACQTDRIPYDVIADLGNATAVCDDP